VEHDAESVGQGREETGDRCGEVRWVRTTADLTKEMADLGGGPLSVDSEADSLHHYHEKVCLVQVSIGGRDLLIDPLAGLDAEPLRRPLEDPGLRKILHGADYDLRVLHRDFGLEIRGLFDTMVAARLVGEKSFGLAALLDRFLGVKLEKKFQRADWSIRPLPPEMEQYAVLDTRYLEPLAACLEQRLTGLGRNEWAAEEFRRLEKVRWNPEGRSGDAYLRIKGAKALDARGLAVLRELAGWRDARARKRDVPLFRVARDEVLSELADRSRKGPASGWFPVRGLGRRWSEGSGRRELLETIERGLAVPEAELPAVPRKRSRRKSRAEEERIRRLCRKRDGLAGTLGLEPSVLASRAVLQEALNCLDGGGDLEGVPGLRRWQLGILEPLLTSGTA